MAYFEAYGALAGEAGVAPMDELLNGRGLLRRRASPEIRACAARALGIIGSASAMEALQRADDEKDVIVRSAIGKALRGGAA
jgi:HEAT repeat protein